MKKIVIALVIILISTIFTLVYFNNKTTFNDNETITGNTGGNLNNGGYFCESDGKVYFSNSYDKGSLYVMDDIQGNYKKLHTDTASSINVIGKYIYYSRNNQDDQSQSFVGLKASLNGVFRLNTNGNKIKSMYNGSSNIINVIGNYIYCQVYDSNVKNLTLKKIKIDASNKSDLSDSAFNPASSYNGKIYYTGVAGDHNIYSIDLETGIIDLIFEDNAYNSVFHNGYIYYISLDDNYSIARVDIYGSNKEIIVNEYCSTFNITNDYLYYQIDDKENSKICINNPDGTNQITIMEGNFNSINITSTYVYFRQFKHNDFYQIPVGATEGVELFAPPSLGKNSNN